MAKAEGKGTLMMLARSAPKSQATKHRKTQGKTGKGRSDLKVRLRLGDVATSINSYLCDVGRGEIRVSKQIDLLMWELKDIDHYCVEVGQFWGDMAGDGSGRCQGVLIRI